MAVAGERDREPHHFILRLGGLGIWLGKRGLKMAFCGNWLGRKNWGGNIVAVRARVKQ